MARTEERDAAALQMLAELRADVADDIAALDGRPFSGKTVAEGFGAIAAEIDALANVLAYILGEERS